MSEPFLEHAYAEAVAADPHAVAIAHLTAADVRLAALIGRAGPCRLPHRASGALRQQDLFAALCESIVSQQLSPKAAETIFGRVRALVDGPLVPAAVLALSDEALRGAGLSGAKTRAVRDLAQRVHDGALDLDTLHALDDDAVVAALSAVRGIGRWTAEMVLIFQLGRLDVLPVGDLGVRKGFQRLFGLPELPKPDRMELLARPFRPYRSIASWYMWRINEEPGATPATEKATKKVAKATKPKAAAKRVSAKKTAKKALAKKAPAKKAAPKKKTAARRSAKAKR
jgi:3-methyladenine DNA glycosylase/8-oxoguanine DNA glycosylase